MIEIDSEELARRVRVHAIRMVNRGGSSHIGSVLSIADILAVLYREVLLYRPHEPKWEGRDRFILSKGHAGAGVYAVLAECGFFDVHELENHCQNGAIFSGHVSHKGVPGVEFSTGSLGHGLPVAAGIALAGKMDGNNYRTIVLMSDGELDEGSNWEAFLFSSHHDLSRLTVIVDRNQLQSMKSTEETLALEPLSEKLNAFGWMVSTVDGHNHEELKEIFTEEHDRPSFVIANTIKGKGVTFMENQVEWHYRTPLDNLYNQALQDLGEAV